jgi:hypothetical protein
MFTIPIAVSYAGLVLKPLLVKTLSRDIASRIRTKHQPSSREAPEPVRTVQQLRSAVLGKLPANGVVSAY